MPLNYTPQAEPTIPETSAAPIVPVIDAAPRPGAWTTLSPALGEGGGTIPPYYPSFPNQTPRRRPKMRIIVIALTLLAALAIGVGLGSILTRSPASARTIVLGSTSAPSVAASTSTLSLQQNLEKVAAAVEPSVVKITSVSGQQEAVGSGDVLTSNGYIVTNDHVVQGYSSYTVTLTSGSTYTATLVGRDAQDDLAVLKISATGLSPISFANSAAATVGQFAVAIGYPLGLQETATYGIVSALNRAVSEAPSGPAGELAGLVQTSAQLNPGNSGGALVNLQGQLIGIPTLSATDSETGSAANGIGYAIPSNRVAYVAEQLIQSGKLTSSDQGFLGIQGADVTPEVAGAYSLAVDSGVLVTGFANDAAGASPAQQGGLQSGDIITAVNGQTVTNSDDLSEDTLSHVPGTKVTLTVIRGGTQQNIAVTLGERPAN
jgi:S1-C subfamily serine protease